MNSRLLSVGILSAILAVGAVAAIGSISTNPIFAQSSDDDDIRDDDDSMTLGNTSAASSNTSKLSGVIASLQNDDAGAPQWITAGHWQLQSDRPLFGDDIEPQVSSFNARIYMASVNNGTGFHPHEISDFRQTSILHSAENVTTVNGTFTITMSDGPHQNTSGYMRLQNNMISIWVDPTEIDEHFGPTPVYGLIVPDMTGHYGDDDWRDDDYDDNDGLRGDDSLDDDADDRQSGNGTRTLGTPDDDNDD